MTDRSEDAVRRRWREFLAVPRPGPPEPKLPKVRVRQRGTNVENPAYVRCYVCNEEIGRGEAVAVSGIVPRRHQLFHAECFTIWKEIQ